MQIPSRKEIIKNVKENGFQIAAILPIHYPKELLKAHKVHPIEVWGPPNASSKAGDSHFQSYTCSIVRNATSFLLDGGLDDMDMIIIPHTCDALQGMASVLKDFIQPKQKVLTLYLPRANRESDVQFLVEELKGFADQLSQITGNKPTDEELIKSIQQEEKICEQIQNLYDNKNKLELTDHEYYSLLRSKEYVPNEIFLNLTNQIRKDENNSQSVSLVLSGIVPEPIEIFDKINKMGAQVVADDFACLSRRIFPKIEEVDPFRYVAKRLLSAPPCPTRGSSIDERINYLHKKMQKGKAKGLIIYDPKFCEPELFDVPLLRQNLSKLGFPVLHLEYDMGEPLSQQTVTRIEAFIEMLK